ncbi:MAG: DUF5117 domain-containing protein, partial [Sphingomonas bacterium]|nr:DUF5117 domain-containing protein [Sphingomonas bacterium]
MIRWACLPLLLATTAPLAASPAQASDVFTDTQALTGLLPVHVDRTNGRLLLTLPSPDADGVSGRFLYVASLRTGIGSSDTGLDHAQNSQTQVIAFRRIGKKIVAGYENPRFRATGGSVAEQAAARESFATTTTWVGDIVDTRADGSIIVDFAPFLTRDTMGIAASLKRGGAGDYRMDSGMTLPDVAATKVFPDNIEMEARQTYVSDKPGDVIVSIAPDPRSITLVVHHSLIRLPDRGFTPIRFDPRFGGFGEQIVDYGAPLGADVV